MPNTRLGKVSVTPKGDFVLGTAYERLDVVYSDSDKASFLARRHNRDVPLTDTDVWMMLVQGVQGIQGNVPTVEAGTVTTGQPGTKAAVSIEQTDTGVSVSFTIPEGEKRSPLKVAGSYDTAEELKASFPDGDGENSYLVSGIIHVWDGAAWKGTGGVDNYEVLRNKPQIGGISLEGNKALEDLGIQSKAGHEQAIQSLSDTIANLTGQVDTAGNGITAAQSDINNLRQTIDNLNSIIAGVFADNAGAHNSLYRGKYLGRAVTAEQYAAIANGSFHDLYIGDYWIFNYAYYRIAAFDYYLRTGDTECTTHHVTLVPDNNMYYHAMNSSNVTTGGYYGSLMVSKGLENAKFIINTAFGAEHILNHRQLLCNAVSDGRPSGGSWYDSSVELMTEQNVYGGKIFGAACNGANNPYLYTIDKSQFPLFAHRPDLISNRQDYWLRDVVSATTFASVTSAGGEPYYSAAHAFGVRPAFSIKS